MESRQQSAILDQLSAIGFTISGEGINGDSIPHRSWSRLLLDLPRGLPPMRGRSRPPRCFAEDFHRSNAAVNDMVGKFRCDDLSKASHAAMLLLADPNVKPS